MYSRLSGLRRSCLCLAAVCQPLTPALSTEHKPLQPTHQALAFIHANKHAAIQRLHTIIYRPNTERSNRRFCTDKETEDAVLSRLTMAPSRAAKAPVQAAEFRPESPNGDPLSQRSSCLATHGE
ncbi:hypothetical protein PDJAM_G00047130 [Pangasius djambal]|uniref:Uncharacterized protein n=1 Tax=Pangasius djambal TaxID=1691987 RepID=A0ACC5YUN1_9TELE|nr:hypothetical protein [Pangasius djambal]